MLVEITKEQENFLKELAHQLNTQDNASTAEPLLFVIHEDEYNYYSEDVSDGVDGASMVAVLENENEYDNIDELREELICGLNVDDVQDIKLLNALNEVFDDDDCSSIEDIQYQMSQELLQKLELEFYCKVKSHRISKHQTHVFFTREAAEKFIKNNNHNLQNPTIFVNHAYRNYEISDMLKIVTHIGEQIKNSN